MRLHRFPTFSYNATGACCLQLTAAMATHSPNAMGAGGGGPGSFSEESGSLRFDAQALMIPVGASAARAELLLDVSGP